jgi:Protein of unknown function (DUF1018)
MTAALAYRFDDRRNMIAKLHIAKKQLGLDEDTYRAALTRITGKDSAKDMSAAELEAVLKDFSRHGFKAARKGFSGPASASAMKIMALWMSGWNLGVITNPSPEAMEAFIIRQTGIAKAQWLKDASDAGKVIDGLKAWLAREAKVDWKLNRQIGIAHYVNWPQYQVCLAQWATLRSLGAVDTRATWTGSEKLPSEEMLNYARIVAGKVPVEMTMRDFTSVQSALGKKLRKALEGK